jgi:hypothetical protein
LQFVIAQNIVLLYLPVRRQLYVGHLNLFLLA